MMTRRGSFVINKDMVVSPDADLDTVMDYADELDVSLSGLNTVEEMRIRICMHLDYMELKENPIEKVTDIFQEIFLKLDMLLLRFFIWDGYSLVKYRILKRNLIRKQNTKQNKNTDGSSIRNLLWLTLISDNTIRMFCLFIWFISDLLNYVQLNRNPMPLIAE